MSAFSDIQNLRSLKTYESSGHSIRVEAFAGGGGEDAPAIIVLHGATGIEHANRFIATLARAFATQGFNVYLVHYFDSTGTQYADDDEIAKSSGAWLQAIRDGVIHVHRQHPRSAIGIFGYSLGGYLAADESVHNDRLAAAVILAGGLDSASVEAVHQIIPCLILHGSEDTRVPVAEAKRMEEFLKQAGGSPQLHIYPGEGHIMEAETYADVVRRGAEFFRQHLGATVP